MRVTWNSGNEVYLKQGLHTKKESLTSHGRVTFRASHSQSSARYTNINFFFSHRFLLSRGLPTQWREKYKKVRFISPSNIAEFMSSDFFIPCIKEIQRHLWAFFFSPNATFKCVTTDRIHVYISNLSLNAVELIYKWTTGLESIDFHHFPFLCDDFLHILPPSLSLLLDVCCIKLWAAEIIEL